jgi:hypothetical protein
MKVEGGSRGGRVLWVVLDLGEVPLAKSSVMKLMKRDEVNSV